MITYYREGKSLEEIAHLFDITVEEVETIRDLEGWDDYLEAENVQKYSELSNELPYPKEVSDLIAQLYFIRSVLLTMSEVFPTPDSLTLLNKVETHILKFTKQHISVEGLEPMTLEEAETTKVEWLREFKQYLAHSGTDIVDAEVVEDD